MEEAITKLNEYRDWVLENPGMAYWIDEDKIQDCIDCLESAKTAEEYCLEQV